MHDAPSQIQQTLKLCFIVEKLADRSGGAERVLIETANALADRGHQVEILSHEFRGKPPFYPLRFGVAHTNLRPMRNNRPRIRRRIDTLRDAIHHRYNTPPFPFDRPLWVSKHGGFWRRLERHLAAHRPDIAIAFMPPAISALALAEPGYPLTRIASMHNAPEQDFHNPKRWDPSTFDRRRRLELMPRMDQILVLLPEYREWYPESLRDKTFVMPNAVEPTPSELLRKRSHRQIVLSVGRLADVKRHALLIDAWAQLVEEFPNWRLRIYGTGPIEKDLATQISRLGLEKNVCLMGHTQEIQKHYLSASLLAHPAEFEGFPLAVTEALSAGLPVVGFEDCSGLNRLVRDGENGILVPAAGDRTQNFANALAGLMRDGNRSRALGTAGPASMAEYDPERVIDRWETMLTKTLAMQSTERQ